MAFDVAVFGSSAAAMLVAGLLKTQHKQSVLLVGEDWSPWLMPHRFDMALLPATRPETWRLLKSGIAETTRLLNGIDRSLVGQSDPVLVAERPSTLRAIAHMRATAAGYGFALEQVADRSLAEPAAAFSLRNVATLEPGAPPAIAAWLAGQDVPMRHPDDGETTIRRDGLVRFTGGADTVEAGRAVFMDDAALLRHLSPEDIAKLFRAVPARSIRTEPASALSAPWITYLDRGVTVTQPGKGLPVTAIVTGESDVGARLGSTLTAQVPLRRVAESRFTRLEPLDGAPLVTASRSPRGLVVCGFGDAAAFFAPALARRIAEASVEEEAAYFAAHELGRGAARQSVADFAAEPA